MSGMPVSSLLSAGSLKFRVAGTVPVQPRRLLVLSHGVGGNEDNLASLGHQAAQDTLVVLPRAPRQLGVGQFAWFQVSFGAHGPQPDLAAAEQSRQELADFIGILQERYGVAPSRTVAAGFSQGGIMSASIGLTRPDLLRGFGVLSGRILPEIEPLLAERAALAGVDAFIGHGKNDTKLPVEWAQRADAWLSQLGLPHKTQFYPGNHGISSDMQRDFFAWLKQLSQY